MPDCKVLWENFFTSHLYSRNFRVLITKNFTFFHLLLFAQFLKTIFSNYSDNWFMIGEFFHKTTVWFSFSKKFGIHLQIVFARKEKNVSVAVYLTVKYYCENFFTSHLYSRNFWFLITKNFTFFHFLLFV